MKKKKMAYYRYDIDVDSMAGAVAKGCLMSGG